MRKILFALLCLSQGAFAAYTNVDSNRITVDHVEGRGLGYSTGYTSLDLFWAEPLCECNVAPYADLRGHYFNNGFWAANGGFGIRWVPDCSPFMLGANTFYDYLETQHRDWQQVSVGLEALGCNWDLRVNGYIPVGETKRPLYSFDYSTSRRDPFILTGKMQSALYGVDTELGYHDCLTPDISFYVGLGPYVYWGRSSKVVNVWNRKTVSAPGVRMRIAATILDYITIEGVSTYDREFRWTGQGIVSITIPFDMIFERDECKYDRRYYAPVLRNEIIAVDTITRRTTNINVLDPENVP